MADWELQNSVDTCLYKLKKLEERVAKLERKVNRRDPYF